MKDSLEIIYQDKDILAVNKPAGVLVDLVGEKYPQAILAHRLDKDTSGVLLLAKNQPGYQYLKEQFKNRRIKKTYLALVEGIIKENKGEINLPIAKSKKDFRKRVAVGLKRGQERQALTLYKVKKRFSLAKSDLASGYSLVEVEPQTGRTHQIRSHFKAIHHPVVCDKLYGFKKLECPFGLTRQFLHALSLELTLPSGSRLKLEADLPEDLQRVLKSLGKVC